MKIVIIILIILAVLVISAFVIGISFAPNVLGIKPQTLDGARKWQEEHYDISWYDDIVKEDFTAESFDGYILHAQTLFASQDSNRYIIISHGYTDNRFGALKYAGMYLDLGYNAVIYDLRGHGENEPDFCTYSIRESLDLNALISCVREKYPSLSSLALHGESLGAASTAAVLKYRPDVDFAVADCGFSDISNVLKNALKTANMPTFIVDFLSLCTKIRYGYALSEMKPIDALKENDIPVLFIHGAEDAFITPDNSRRMSEATKGYSEFHTIPGAGHAESILKDRERYAEIVKAFIGKISE